MQGWTGRGLRIATTSAAVLVSVGALAACSDGGGDAEGADPAASAAEATPAAPATTEPAEPETTAEPTSTETETSEWTAEEQALIDEAEAFYAEANDAYVRQAQAGFQDDSAATRLMEMYSGDAADQVWSLMGRVREAGLHMEGTPRIWDTVAESVVLDGDGATVILASCVDSTGVVFVDDDGEGNPSTGLTYELRDPVVFDGTAWVIDGGLDSGEREC
ncbi:hypothetical protein [Serinibacter salmoneus]|uniref:Mce-associated membrane protein n=1 Tax=Serinibacter salmoneus TaxID=556530 RepID=A0A2A9D1T5_9MICO|nr:hypothetical protein [Serinibacter salmoneus]PFG20678.1 hypothetical protein ATL40_2288 [Serinibacter salmoneus]